MPSCGLLALACSVSFVPGRGSLAQSENLCLGCFPAVLVAPDTARLLSSFCVHMAALSSPDCAALCPGAAEHDVGAVSELCSGCIWGEVSS